MTDSGNFARREFLRQEFEGWQSRYYHDVYSLFEQGDGQRLLTALERWEAGFRAFLQDRFPKLATDYDAHTTPSIPLEQIADAIQDFKPYISNQIEAFLAKCIENVGKGSLDQYYVAPGSVDMLVPPAKSEPQAVKVFISYTHHDQTFAKKLAGELESQGMQVWWDFERLQGGQDWQKEIERALKECDFLLVILTPEAVASEWVGNEVTYASRAQKTIIPLRLRKCEIPIALIKKQYIDFEKQTQNEAIKELIGILKAPSVVE